MPCNCDHMEANRYEIEISKVACLLDELSGKKINPSHWRGYHPDVYCKVNKEMADAKTAELCAKLQDLDVSALSLEMQMWWRDHKAADEKRKHKELLEEIRDAQRKEALNLLTPYRRELLGLK